MGGHVDDFHQIGDQSSDEWLDIRGKIDKLFQWGMSRDGSYRHAGTDVTTFYDKAGLMTISVDQQYYIEALQDIDIEPSRLMQPDMDLTNRDIGACRAAIGALQWLAHQTQPQICARCNILMSELMSGKKMSTAKEIMGDSAHSNRPDGESTGGLLTLAAGPDVIKGGVVPMSIIGWKSWKLKRRAISSNDAEVQALVEAEDANFRVRLLWAELHGTGTQATGRIALDDNAEDTVKQTPGIVCTDSRGGYDAVQLHESPLLGLSNMRAALQAFQVKQSLQRSGTTLRWLASDYNAADSLTKKAPSCRDGLWKLLKTGMWCVAYDPTFQAAKKAAKQGNTALRRVQRHIEGVN